MKKKRVSEMIKSRIISAINCILGNPTIAFVEFGEDTQLKVKSKNSVIVGNKFLNGE